MGGQRKEKDKGSEGVMAAHSMTQEARLCNRQGPEQMESSCHNSTFRVEKALIRDPRTFLEAGSSHTPSLV